MRQTGNGGIINVFTTHDLVSPDRPVHASPAAYDGMLFFAGAVDESGAAGRRIDGHFRADGNASVELHFR